MSVNADGTAAQLQNLSLSDNITLVLQPDIGNNVSDAVLPNADGVRARIDTNGLCSLIWSIPWMNDGAETRKTILEVQREPWKIVTQTQSFCVKPPNGTAGYDLVVFNGWLKQLQAVVRYAQTAANRRTNPQNHNFRANLRF